MAGNTGQRNIAVDSLYFPFQGLCFWELKKKIPNLTCLSLSVFYLMKNVADLNDSFCSPCCFSLLILCFTESGAAVCEYFMRNMCNRGPLCPFRHTKGEKTVVCKHWLRGLCKKGDQCEFLHEYDMTKMPECYFYSKFGEFVLMLLGYYQHYIPAEFL